MPAIEVHELCKRYGDRVAVDAISFSVADGEVVALLGPNGAGKTTTVELLEGHRRRSSGSVQVLGLDPQTAGMALRRRIGIVLQEPGFDGDLTVAETITLFASFYGRARSLDDVLTLARLGDARSARVRTLSGGQHRRLDLAVGLVGCPELLFLDEPTTGFDPEARHLAWEALEAIRAQGTTILLTTHYLEEVEQLADRALVLVDGRIIAAGTPHELGGRSTGTAEISFRLANHHRSGDLPMLNGTGCGGMTVVAAGGRPRQWRLVRGQVTYQTRLLLRSPSGPFFTFVIPLMLLITLDLVYGSRLVPGRDVKFPVFYTPAMAAFAVANACFVNVANTTTIAPDTGVLQRLHSAPLPASVYVAGRVLSAGALAALSMAGVLATGAALFHVHLVVSTLPGTALMLVAAVYCDAMLGLAITPLIPSADAALPIAYGLFLPVAFISEVFFPTTGSPAWLRTLAAALPLQPQAHAFSINNDPDATGWGVHWALLGITVGWGVAATAVVARWFRWQRAKG